MVGAALAVVASLALAGSALAAASITNGGFNNTSNTYVGGIYDRLYAGSTTSPTSATAIPGWTVTAGNIDWIDNYWSSEDGDGFSLDMNGDAPGAISQTIDTTVNTTYVVQFYLSGNPDPNSYCGTLSNCDSPPNKTLIVTANGGTPADYSFDTSVYGNTHSNMDWQVEGYSFVASGSSTTLTFTSTTAGAFGPALDAVSVTETAATGASCKDGGWKTMYDSSGNLFRNQGACVSFYATSGAVPIGN